ncbi:zinc-ribbon domain-containing protein [Litchfieldia salsa]|nr:zinc-ribbon domain-containing protein [Litchfieldia salsa]
MEVNQLEILEEWDLTKNVGLCPDTVSYGSEKRVSWICFKCKYDWETSVNRRTSKKGSGCPKCSKKKQIERSKRTKLLKSGSLQEKAPQLLNDWDYKLNEQIVPSNFSIGSNQIVWWKCPICTNSYQASIYSRTLGSGCPGCKTIRRNKTMVKRNGSLFSVHPELEKEWHPQKNKALTLKDVTSNSNKKVWWQCEKGHEWQAPPATRGKGHGCPYCAGLYPTKKNNLLVKSSRIAKEWHPTKNGNLIPENISPYSMKKVWWQCQRGHEWQASVSNRYQGRDCAQCSSELRSSFPEQSIIFYLSKVFNVDSRTMHNGWEVDIYLPDYNIGIEYDGIAYHSKKHLREREIRKNNALSEIGLDLIRIKESYESDEIIDQTIFFIVNHSYKNFPTALRKLFHLLEVKTKKKIEMELDIDRDRIGIMNQYIMIQKKNSFAANFHELINLWNNKKNMKLRPDTVSAMSNKKVWWNCEEGHEWEETVINVAKGNRCPYCSNHKVLAGYNDFESKYPNLAREWNYEKNYDLDPSEVTPGSNKKVWWVCENNHEYRATVASRVRNRNCPQCRGRYRDTTLQHELWNQKYEQAKAYFLRNKNLEVKATYVCENGFKLGQWIRTQRVSYKNNDLTLERFKMLEDIGMIWSSKPGAKQKNNEVR